MEKLTKEQAKQVEIIKEYAKGQEDFSFAHLIYDFNEYYPEMRATRAKSIPALDIVAAVSGRELTQLERAYYKGYEVEPDWKFNIGDIVYLDQGGIAERRLWFVADRFSAGDYLTYGLCAGYNPHPQAYRSDTAGPYTSVSGDRLILIKKKSEWVKAIAPTPPMHPGCGHGSKTQY